MANEPVTSITLLKEISGSSTSARWCEFWRKYEQPMRGFLQSRFPSLERDDALQETMAALVKALPNYHYTPDEKGHFRNYLMGILHNKATDILRRRASEHAKIDKFANDPSRFSPPVDERQLAFQRATMEAAVDQLMADEAISPTTREVFRHVALLHEKPEAVAARFGLSRNNVDQIKSRMLTRLSTLVAAMMA